MGPLHGGVGGGGGCGGGGSGGGLGGAESPSPEPLMVGTLSANKTNLAARYKHKSS